MDLFFALKRTSTHSLQRQLRDHISEAILDGRIAVHTPLPSSRRLSQQLGISRNTVTLAYSALQDDGFIMARDRSGFYVNPTVAEDRVRAERFELGKSDPGASTVDWDTRVTLSGHTLEPISRPANWRDFPFCFVYGQIDPHLFPIRHWRECWRDAAGVQEITDWSQDLVDRDDNLLVEQVRLKLLPRRGLWVNEDQVLITVGAQNALYIAMKLLLNPNRQIGLENPGYPDARQMASLFTDKIKPLPIDTDGLMIGPHMTDCDLVYLTPSHQSPTTVTLSEARRHDIVKHAERDDFLLLEDDYEAEINFAQQALPALMSYDSNGRVIYVGSLSKTLAPGLRLGYLVGPPHFIQQARALRRLIMRHPAANNQRAAAYFLARGYHESLLRALIRSNKKKRDVLVHALNRYLPEWKITPNRGGSSVWITGPNDLNTLHLSKKCALDGIMIEPGHAHYLTPSAPVNTLRLGFTSIPLEHIETGIARIARIYRS